MFISLQFGVAVMTETTRRQALSAMGWLGASFVLSGCSLPITPFCPTDPTISDPSTPLTIDAHTHVFNGSDLQIEGFFSRILAVNEPSLKGLGVILQELGRDFAPTAAEEMVELPRIDAVLRSCSRQTTAQMIGYYQQAGYSKAARELKAAVRRVRTSRLGRSGYISPEIQHQIQTLPDSYATYKSSGFRHLKTSPESINVLGGIDFIIRNFQFRYVNVYDYLFEYSQEKTRRIDLLVAHLVDFDWPIGNGNPTPTSLSDQVRVMERISQLSGGRVLCFAPFDPMKEVAYQLGVAPESSLRLVQDAVSFHGFIGVKLYPPMGFAPLGNASLRTDFWNQTWIPATLHRSDLGKRLDQALSDLYSWCQMNGVPIMAHTSPTNGPSADFAGLTKARYWKYVRDAFPGIRIDFGHFGDTDLIGDNSRRARHLSDLMNLASGEFLYADTSYLVDLLSRQPELQAYLTSLLRYSAGKGDAALAQRLMYGTDWEMVILEGRKSDQYLQRFETMFNALDHEAGLGAKGKLSDRFFGINAAVFLGLGTGQKNRLRLDSYYAIGPKPAWMLKVDQTAAATT
jgi:hypothetical protein